MMKTQSYEQIIHQCKNIDGGYENVINAVFKQGYDDLVALIRKSYRFMLLSKLEKRTMLKWELHDEAMRAIRDTNALCDWFRVVMPMWRDIDPERIIKQAYKECEDDTEAVFAAVKSAQG